MKKLKILFTYSFKNQIGKLKKEIASLPERLPNLQGLKNDMKRSVTPCFGKFAFYRDVKTQFPVIKPITGFASEESAKRHFSKDAVGGEVKVIDSREANDLTHNFELARNFCPCADLFATFFIEDREGNEVETIQSIAKFLTVEKAVEEFAKIALGEVKVINRQQADEFIRQRDGGLSTESRKIIEQLEKEIALEEAQQGRVDHLLIAYSNNLRPEKPIVEKRPLFFLNRSRRKKSSTQAFFQSVNG